MSAQQYRCTFNHSNLGPQCVVETDKPGSMHEGPHLFKCAGKHCPGLIWPASIMPHPYTCVSGPQPSPLAIMTAHEADDEG